MLEHHELQDHFDGFGHKEPGLLRWATRVSIDLTLGFALITGGAIPFGAVLAAMILSAKILLLLGIPAILVLTWWIWRA